MKRGLFRRSRWHEYYYLGFDPKGRLNFGVNNGMGGPYLPHKSPSPLKEWIHVAGTYDGAVLRLYVNGAEVASREYSGTFGDDNNPLNSAFDVADELLNGRSDEVRIYNRALTAKEIRSLYIGQESADDRKDR